MVKSIIIILIVGFALAPMSGMAAMKAMTNDSLKQVKGASDTPEETEFSLFDFETYHWASWENIDIIELESFIGSMETTEHFLLECSNYNHQRQILSRSLQNQCGNLTLDIETFLDIEGHTEVENWRVTIQTEMGIFHSFSSQPDY